MKIEINLTDQQLAEIVAKLNIPKPKSKYFVPNQDEIYYFLLSNNAVDWCRFINDSNDMDRYNAGNCYSTKEEAQLKAKHNLLYTKLVREIAELNGDWVCDWSELRQLKAYITYNSELRCFVRKTQYVVKALPNSLYGTEQTIKNILSTWSKEDLYLALYGEEL